MRRGYLTPPVIIILALITLFVAATLLFNTFLLKGEKQPTLTPSVLPTPSPKTISDETTNWKTYTNDVLKYSLKYPLNWYVYELKNYPYEGYPGVIQGNEIIITSSPRFPKDDENQYIGIEILKIEDVQGRIKTLQEFRYPSGEKDKVEQLSLNGVTAYRVTQLDNDVEWLMPNKNGTDGVSVSILSRSVESNEIDIIDQILSTFQFTN
jgi:hypothetical protein